MIVIDTSAIVAILFKDGDAQRYADAIVLSRRQPVRVELDRQPV